MKFLADENVEKPVVDWFRNQNFDVVYIAEKASSISDEEIIKFTNSEDRILTTNDKGFGELVFHQKKISKGILLIRAANEKSSNKIALIKKVLEIAKSKLEGNLVVVSKIGIRIKKI